MSRTISNKSLQTVVRCQCGCTTVDHDQLPIRYKDFTKAGIVRKKDRSTGTPFLLQRMNVESCNNCCPG